MEPHSRQQPRARRVRSLRKSYKPCRPGEISPCRTRRRNRFRPIRDFPGSRRQVRRSNPDLRQQSRLKAPHLLLHRARRDCGPIRVHPFPSRKRPPVQLRLPLLPEPVRAQRQPSLRQQAAMPVCRARRRCLRAVRRSRRRQHRAQPLRRPPVQPRPCRGHLLRCNRGRKASGRHPWRHRPVRRRQAPPRGPFSPQKQHPDRHGPLRRQVRVQAGRPRQFNSRHRDRHPERLPLLEVHRRWLRAARPRRPLTPGRYLLHRYPVPSLRKRRRAGLRSVHRPRYRKGPRRPRQMPR